MKNTTISLEETTLANARKFAEKLGYSFNAWIKKIIEDAIKQSPHKSVLSLLSIADKCAGNSKGKSWSRVDIYER